jgi:superfamily II DNA helicase RecQ
MTKLHFYASVKNEEVKASFMGLDLSFAIPCGCAVTLIDEEGVLKVIFDVVKSDAVLAPEVNEVPEMAVFTPVNISDIKSDDELKALRDKELFTILFELRRDLAVSQRVPSYIIFNDHTLREMARLMPMTLDAFSRISGVGQMKLERYGQMFIDAVSEFLTGKVA